MKPASHLKLHISGNPSKNGSPSLQHLQDGSKEASLYYKAHAFVPDTDVWESEDAFHLALILPGVSQADLQVNVKDGYVIISGKRSTPSLPKTSQHRLMESQFGSFARKIKLSATSDTHNMTTQLSDGILWITIPKKATTRQLTLPLAA